MKPRILTVGNHEGVYGLTVETTCNKCHAKKLLAIPKLQWDRWQNGTSIQTAIPDIPKEDRELLISGICGTCWSKIFQGNEN